MVGVDEMAFDVQVGDAIRAGHMHRRQLREEATVGGVGAVVDGDPCLAGGDGAVVAHTGGDVDHHALAPPIGREELFATREDETHRPLGGPGERGDVGLVVEAALAAETTAEVGTMMRTRLAGSSECLAHPGAGIERHLRRCPDGDLVALPLGHNRTWLDRRGMAAIGDVPAGDHVVGLGQAGFHIAFA